MSLLPDKSNAPIIFTDGKMRMCPNCNEPMANYTFKYAKKEIARLLNGFICTECDYISVSRRILNDIIENYSEKC